MALITCPDCQERVSEKAKECIHCGYPIFEMKNDPANYFCIPEYPNKFSLTGKISSGLVYGGNMICYYPHELNKDLFFDEGEVVLEVYENGFSFWKSIFDQRYIQYSQIVDLRVEEVNTYTQKDKSVIGRAAVGGLLLGGVGAIVGGLSGQGKKAMKFDSVVSVIYHHNDNFHQVILPFNISKMGNRYLSKALLKNYKAFSGDPVDAPKAYERPESIGQDESQKKDNLLYGSLLVGVFIVIALINFVSDT